MAEPVESRPPDSALLDQSSSVRLAATLAHRPDWPQGAEDLNSPSTVLGAPRPAWRRHGLRFVFLAVSLFAFFGAGVQLVDLTQEGSFGLADLVTVAFAAFLAVAVFTQLRGFAMLTPLAPRLRRDSPAEIPPAATPLLHQAPSLPADLDATGTSVGRGASTRRTERLITLIAVGVGGLAVVSLVAILIYGAVVSGPRTELLLGGAFVCLAGFGYFQFLRALGQAGWRGSPAQIGRRAFYDSSRIYTGSSLFVQTAVTGGAAVVLATAGLAPVVFDEPPRFDIVGFGDEAGTIYRVQPEDGSLSQVTGEGLAEFFSPLAVVPRGVKLPNGNVLRRQTVVAVVSTDDASGLVAVDIKTGRRTPITRLERRIDPVGLAIVAGRGLMAIEVDGTLLSIEPGGNLVQVGSLGRTVDAAGYDPVSQRFLVLAQSELLVLDVDDFETNSLGVVEGLDTADPCGIARVGPGIIVGDRISSALIVVDPKTLQIVATIGPSPLPATICGLVAMR